MSIDLLSIFGKKLKNLVFKKEVLFDDNIDVEEMNRKFSTPPILFTNRYDGISQNDREDAFSLDAVDEYQVQYFLLNPSPLD